MPDTTSDERLLQAIDAAEENAYGAEENGELAKQRAEAIRFYLGENTRPAPEGRSQVVDRSVFETIWWILPSLVEIFANGDDVVSLPPIGREDEESAKQEGQFLNHIALQKTPWFKTCLVWFLDALLTKNAYVHVYRDMRREVSLDEYERQTTAGVAMLLSDEGAELLKQESYPDPDGGMEPVMGEDGEPVMMVAGVDPVGQPIMEPHMQPAMLHDVTIRTVTKSPRYCIDVLPPERCKVSEQTPSFGLEGCDYFEFWDEKTLSDIRSMGFDVPDDISDDDSPETEEEQARDHLQETREDDEHREPAMRRVRLRTIWIQHDYDEDGIAELRRVLRIGRTILDNYETSRISIASIVPIILPHRHMGLSVHDMVADLQEIKTAILRGGLDNLYLSNNQRIATSNKVTIEDVLLSRPGQPIRVDTDLADVQGHVVPVVHPFIFPQAMEGLAAMDAIKDYRVGTNRNFNGLDQNALSPNQSGVAINQLVTMAGQRVKLIARIIACGVEDLFSLLHEVVLKSGHKKESIQLRGQWVEVDPGTWRKRDDFRISVGFAGANKDAMVQRLMLLATKQGEALAGGVPIVTPQNLYETAIEITKASDFSSPERFWTEPSKVPPPQPPQPDPTVMAAEKLRSDTQVHNESLKAQTDKYESDNRVSIEKYRADLDARIKLELADKQAQNERDTKAMEVRAGAEMEGIRARLKVDSERELNGNGKMEETAQVIQALMQSQSEQTKQIGQMLEASIAQIAQIAQMATAGRRVRRGKDGRAEGIDLVGPDGTVLGSQNVMRGPDGKVMGTQ